MNYFNIFLLKIYIAILKGMTMKKLSCVLIVFYLTSPLAFSAKNAGNKISKFSPCLNYANDYNWVSKPKKIDKPVDVFYVHPTIYSAKSPHNMDISTPGLRTFAKGLTVAQAGVYSKSANLFAPFYRQQSGAVQDDFTARGGTNMFIEPSFQLGARDVEAAFDYYLKHFNNDRPFIIAGHSQGTMTLINLMRKRFNDSKLQKQLVAAYLIGYSVTKNDLKKYPWMKRAQGAEDTGVIITYNTEGPGSTGSPVCLKGAIAINPLNWENDSTPAKRSAHLGAVFFNAAKGKLIEKIDNFAEAHVDTEKGVLVITNMKKPVSPAIDLVHLGRFPAGVYHKFDYAFWFNNLKDNVKKRINSYLKQRASKK
jgi:Protein of unknown function (DUF3089)